MRFMALSALVLATAACNVDSAENQLENSIRESLSNGSTVQEVNLTEQDDGNMTGYATIQDREGRSGRLGCTAHKTDDAGNYNWRCEPVIDDAVLREMEASFRRELGTQGEVVEVSMRRHNDDNHMIGHAVVRVDGADLRLACNAVRDPGSGRFNGECQQEGEGGEGE